MCPLLAGSRVEAVLGALATACACVGVTVWSFNFVGHCCGSEV